MPEDWGPDFYRGALDGLRSEVEQAQSAMAKLGDARVGQWAMLIEELAKLRAENERLVGEFKTLQRVAQQLKDSGHTFFTLNELLRQIDIALKPATDSSEGETDA